MLKKLLVIFLSGFLLPGLQAQQPSNAKMDAFVAQLMNKMTIDERIGQLNFRYLTS